MVCIAIVAVSVTALSQQFEFLSVTYFSLVLLLLAFAVLTSILGKHSSRSFWVGFAFFGWGYIALVFGWTGLADGNLVTTYALNESAEWMGDTQASQDPIRSTFGPFDPYGAPNQVPNSPSLRYLRVGHGCWALCLALLGGVSGQVVAAVREREQFGLLRRRSERR